MSASAPPRLGDQAFLLAYDVFRDKLIDQQWYLVRAAVLTDLFLLGRLADHDGSAVAIDGPVDDPILRSTLDEITASPARTWQEWVVEDAWATYLAVRTRLMAQGQVVEQSKRILGFTRARKITVGDAAAVEQLITEVRTAVLVDPDPSAAEVDQTIAALAALADAIDLNSVFTWDERRRYRDRIDHLGAPIQPITAGARAAFAEVAQRALRTGNSTAVM